MRGRIFFTVIFTALFFAAFFIFNAGAQSETFITAETIDTASDCSSNSGYSAAGQFVDGEGNNVYLCVKRNEFVSGNSYVRDSYFEMASGNDCIDSDNNLIKVGSFSDVNENGVFLCRRAEIIGEGAQSLLISDVTVRENECPSDYVQSGPVINSAGGKKIVHCVKFKDSQRGERLDSCGGYTFNAGDECVYDVAPGGDGADVGEELGGVLRGDSPDSCTAQVDCVCRGANIYPQSAGWECSIAGGSGEGSEGDGGSDGDSGGSSGGGGESSVGECTDSDGTPSNIEEIANSESIFTKGEVRAKNEARDVTSVFADSCEGEFVLEAYCDANGDGQKEKVACSEGKSCFLGRCVDPLATEFNKVCIIFNPIWVDSSLNEVGTAIGEIKITDELENAESVQSADTVALIVFANSPECVGKNVEFKIYEDDLFANPFIKTLNAKITSDGFAIAPTKLTWFSDIQGGNSFDVVDNPEFFFEAKMAGDNRKISSDNLELFPPQITGSDYSGAEVLWDEYTSHSMSDKCPNDKFMVGLGNLLEKHCAELKRTADDRRILWNGNSREISIESSCASKEASVGVSNSNGKRNCVKMKLSDSEDKVVLGGTREISKTNDCRKSEVVIKSEGAMTYCALVLVEEAESASDGGSSGGGLFGGGLSFIGDLLQLVLSIFGF